jgi:hypothetical protein
VVFVVPFTSDIALATTLTRFLLFALQMHLGTCLTSLRDPACVVVGVLAGRRFCFPRISRASIVTGNMAFEEVTWQSMI